MILTHINDIDETLKLTQGQGHKVKGQGHICIYVKFFFRLLIMNGWIDLNDTLEDDALGQGEGFRMG